MISVVFSEGPRAGWRVDVDRDLIVGREGADIVVDDQQISRRHLLLKPIGDRLHVEDLGSSNGTVVNGYRISEPAGAGDGDAIGLGTSELIVHVTAPPDPSMPHPMPAPAGEVPSGRPGPVWLVTAAVEIVVIVAALGSLVYYAAG